MKIHPNYTRLALFNVNREPRNPYVFSVAVIILAYLLRELALLLIGDRPATPIVVGVYYPAMIICASYGRLKSGLFATVLSSLIIIEHTLSHYARVDYGPFIVNLILFVLSGIWLSFRLEKKYRLTVKLNNSLQKNNVYQSELKQHQDELEELVRQRTRDLELTQDVVIECMVKVGEFRNTEVGDHIVRTRSYVKTLIDELKTVPKYQDLLNEEYRQLLIKCVPLHDIGKVVIPDSILLKPGRLTGAEFEIVKSHAKAGKDILISAQQKFGEHSFLNLAMQMAESHHEQWNGNGYPHGLSGENIPFPGRIMAIADVYDAMVSERVYKPNSTHEQAIQTIINGRGTHFDPELVDVLIKIQDQFKVISQADVRI